MKTPNWNAVWAAMAAPDQYNPSLEMIQKQQQSELAQANAAAAANTAQINKDNPWMMLKSLTWAEVWDQGGNPK